MRRSLWFAVVLTAIFAACGSGSTSEPAEPVVLDLKMTEFAYEPAEITVAPGAEVTITAKNESVANSKHDLLIVSGVFTELVQVKNATVVAELGLVQPGESDSLVVTFDEPGVYQFICTVTGHFVAGMHGTITVEG